MKNNSKTTAIILLTVIGASILFLVYYFYLKPDAVSPLLGQGLVTESGLGVDDLSAGNLNSLSSQTGRDLLSLLNDLESISFNPEFIQGVGYASLEDHTHILEEQIPGRENPFAPVQ